MSLFHSQNSTRSGFGRATIGTLLTIGGIVACVFVGVPRLHYSMTAAHEPVLLSCVELLRDGLPENSSIIVLRDAQVHPLGEIRLAVDGQTPSPMLAQIHRVLASPRAASVVDRMVRADVLPRGMAKRPGPQPLRLSHGRETAQVAIDEIEKTGSLTVHVSENPTARLVCKAADYFQFPVPEILKQSASLPAYSLHPASLIGPQRDAIAWVVGGACAVALGLILCGSSPLGWWALLSPITAVLGLPGMILRSGRGGKFTWLLSLGVGAACLAGGYHLAITMGRLGQVAGVWVWQATGLLTLACGAAAMLGTILSMRASWRDEPRDALANFIPAVQQNKATKKRSKRRHDGNAQSKSKLEPRPVALQSMIAANDYTRRYLDPRLNVSPNMQTETNVRDQTESLERLQFDSPLIIQIARGEDTIEATVQIGCRNLVLAMTDCLEGHMRLRMVSILEDGHVVISGNGQDDRLADTIHGEASSHHTFKIDIASKMVTKHLEVAAEIAMHKRTKLVHLDPSEWRDMVHYSERCMANTLHHAHVEKWEIGDAHYGRFTFPPREVRSLSLA